MQKRFAHVALECLFDLGATVVYAVIAGLLIVGVVASDGSVSIVTSVLYASILPGAVLVLIGFELAARVYAEWRRMRRQQGSSQKSRHENGLPAAI